MKTALSNRTVGMIIAAFLFAALPHLAAMPLPVALVILGAAGWRAAAARWHLRPPHWTVRTLLTFGGLGLVIVHFGTLWGRRAATVMLCVMLAAKLTEMFRLRDARMVAALGYFLIATQFLFSQRLILFAYLLAGCWLATAALVQIQRDADGPGAGTHAPSHPWAGLKSGLALMVLAVPFALVLFALFPRLASPLWGMPDEALDGRTGLSDEMSPGTIANLFSDDSPAFRVEFDGPVPPRHALYWRGPVLWRFDGRTWRRLFYSNRPPERLPRRDGSAFSYRVQLEPNERRWLFSLDYPVRWPEDARLTADFELIRRRPVTSLLEYRVVSQPRFDDRPALPHTLRQLALALPEGSNPRTREHARQLRQEYPDDRALIAAVLEWFNTDPFVYSLETMPLGRHGADEFLFDLRRGYCEYYASAFAVLMRAAGIPTRIVTGYQGGHWQGSGQGPGQGPDQGGYLLVRHSDAHAWTEVWLAGEGWVRVDPTAAVSPDRIEQGARAALPDQGWFDAEWLYALRNRYDRLQHLWNQWVLGFDAARQHSLLNRMGLGTLPNAFKAVLLIALAGLILVPLALVLHAMVHSPARPEASERAWLRIRRRLARAGIRPDPADTPLELARRAAPRLANGDELVALAAQYCLCRYGPFERNRLEELDDRSRRWVPRLLNSRGTATV